MQQKKYLKKKIKEEKEKEKEENTHILTII